MPIGWFDASEAKNFGSELARFFIEQFPSDPAARKERSPAKLKAIFDKMFNRIDEFKRQHKLNIYKKAQLGNTFKWALMDAGYEENFADELTRMLIQLI